MGWSKILSLERDDNFGTSEHFSGQKKKIFINFSQIEALEFSCNYSLYTCVSKQTYLRLLLTSV